MKLRPQSALIPKITQQSKSDFSINMSQLLFHKKSNNNQQAPDKYFQDQESLYFQNMQLKQEMNEIRYENMKLKTLNSQLQKRVQQIEKVDNYQRKVAPLGLKQSGEGSIVPMLKSKIKQQTDEIDELREDLRKQYKSVKLTSLLEMQKEIKNYQDEILKLNQLVQASLNIQDQDLYKDPDISQRLSNFVLVVNAQENQIQKLCQQNDKIKQENAELNEELIKLREESKQLSFEKTQYKKQLEEVVITENELYQIKKREFLEKKLQESFKQSDNLKGELSLNENKLRQLQKQYKEMEKDYKIQLTDLSKIKQQLEDTLIKREQMIQDLQDRVTILDLLKQKNSPKPVDSPLHKLQPPPITYRDKDTQFPEEMKVQVQDQINSDPIDKNRLYKLLHQMKYILLSKRLTKERLKYVFNNQSFIQLKDTIILFQGQPFNFTKEDSIILSRYLVGEDCGTSSKMQLEDTQEINDLINVLYDQIGDKISIKTIINWNNQTKLINYQLNNSKIAQDIIYTQDEYILQLKANTQLNMEQIEMILMVNYYYSSNNNQFDHKFFCLYFKQEYELQQHHTNLTQMDMQIYQSKQSKKIIQEDEEYEDNYPPISKQTNSVTNNQVQSILDTQQILSMSTFNKNDQLLKNSETRKPQNNFSSDLFNYSSSRIQVQSIPVVQQQEQYENASITFQFEKESPAHSEKQPTPIKSFDNNNNNNNQNSSEQLFMQPPCLKQINHFQDDQDEKQYLDEQYEKQEIQINQKIQEQNQNNDNEEFQIIEEDDGLIYEEL